MFGMPCLPLSGSSINFKRHTDMIYQSLTAKDIEVTGEHKEASVMFRNRVDFDCQVDPCLLQSGSHIHMRY